jgi:hypothetical protein
VERHATKQVLDPGVGCAVGPEWALDLQLRLPDGHWAVWQSDTDSTLLRWNTGCDPNGIKDCEYHETSAGHAYLDGPEPTGPAPTPAGSGPIFKGQSPESCQTPPNFYDPYLCEYPYRTLTTYRSATDWAVISYETAGAVHYTPDFFAEQG